MTQLRHGNKSDFNCICRNDNKWKWYCPKTNSNVTLIELIQFVTNQIYMCIQILSGAKRNLIILLICSNEKDKSSQWRAIYTSASSKQNWSHKLCRIIHAILSISIEIGWLICVVLLLQSQQNTTQPNPTQLNPIHFGWQNAI